MRWISVVALIVFGLSLSACKVMRGEGETLRSDYYRVRRPQAHQLPKGRLFVEDEDDTLRIYLPTTSQPRLLDNRQIHNLTLYRRHFDVDVFTIPFKIRPAIAGVPPQLNSNFNAALYLGRRIDFYRFQSQTIAPHRQTRLLRSQGFGYGFFAGIGSSTINELVTRGAIGFEYEGVIVDAGLAVIYDARLFNVGIATGMDHLVDSNRRQWIYQWRPWFGVLFGLNLN